MRKFLMALALGCLSTAGNAATYLITYTGTISSGTDTTGVFGAAGASLAGKAFNATYTLDYPAAGATDTSANGLHTVSGGTYAGTVSPISATFSVNGFTRNVSGAYYGEVDKADNYYGYDMLTAIANDTGTAGGVAHSNVVFSTISSNTNNITTSVNLADLLNYAAGVGDNPAGAFQFWSYDQASGNLIDFASGYLTTQQVTVAPAAVPEPATWAMMLGGFGMIGGAMRRRRTQDLSFA